MLSFSKSFMELVVVTYPRNTRRDTRIHSRYDASPITHVHIHTLICT